MRNDTPAWLQQNVQLQPYNTLSLPAIARYFTTVDSLADLQAVLVWAKEKDVDVLPLGGGSNVVLADDYDGLVICLRFMGRELIDGQDGEVLVRAAAGEEWHSFVCWTLEQDCFGLENLSLIPGTVGAAPIQNIGAYGVEIQDVFHSLEAVNVRTGELVTYAGDDCRFGYRDSVFKGEDRDCFIITSVTFALTRTFAPTLGYGELHREVECEAQERGCPVSAALVSDVVCRIREAKLPDPGQIGNAGSFFKNPVVAETHFQRLKGKFENLVAYPAGEGHWKLAAGWLIDQCGFKGVTHATSAGVYQNQALVLVNHGGASGKDILALADEIKAAVWARFAVELEIEPRIYG
ncbi:UDP-N-acetylmuramate dehydrogenase [Parendozoicomonas haliclonae]|uniref:UDP-N-acetylenolpyruvoylglucosamine reductase n=1 Tax=Parendozoicomonas haliclonae TaxID=1960125 RepID=A0A1X7API7_9GAMM|nr:UDP-N-acetylmuramate dehydrogenase [Parendozoicomonas haliclonae]SMA49183.1 UDP-N-acetylenolpyruvoylglucosamine reductase [Parendozoicomonas haliclonae]